MLEILNVEFIRIRLHGADSSITFLQEDDTHFDKLSELLTDCAISNQRDSGGGPRLDKLTCKLKTTTQKADFEKADACILRIGTNFYRYALEDKARNPLQDGSLLCYATCRAIFNEATPVEDPE